MNDEIWQLGERSSAADSPRTKQKSPRGAFERSFAVQLEHAMASQRLTPDSLSVMAGISAASVRNYLRARFLPRHKIIAALEEVLQVRFDLHDPSVTEAPPMPAENGPAVPSSGSASSNTSSGVTLQLTIGEAKSVLARTLGVGRDDIEIIVRG